MSNIDYIEEELDVKKLLKLFLDSRKTILKITILFTVIGLLSAFLTKKEYEASTVFVPQGVGQKKMSGNLGGLAALAGINIGSGAEASGIPSSLYPDILQSIPFQKELINTKLTIKGQEKKVTFGKYYTEIYNPGFLHKVKKYTIGLPGVIMSSFKKKSDVANNVHIYQDSDTIIYVTPKEKGLIDNLQKRVIITVDQEDNFVEIKGIMPESIAAAELTYAAKELLEKYIINYKIEKSADKLKFIEKRLQEKEEDFKRKRFLLARYQDKNKYASTLTSQTRLLSLQADYNLAFNVYNDLAQQIEKQKIQVKEDTPIFTIIKPVSIPTSKSGSSFASVFYKWMISGFVLGILWVFGRDFFKKIKKELTSEVE